MKNKVIALFAVIVLLAGAAPLLVSNAAETDVKGTAQTPSIISLLPASDLVALVNVRRGLTDALPMVLASNQPMLGKMNAELDKMQTKIGIDLRQFEHVAVGMTMTPVSAKDFDVDLVAVARGTFNVASLVSLAKLGSKGAYREEKIGGRSVYVFSVKDVAKKAAPKSAKPAPKSAIDRSLDKIMSELALMSIDTNTIAIGSLTRIRQTAAANTTVNPELVSLLTRRPTAVMSFAFKTPEGMAKFLPMDNDELGKNIGAIRYLAGSMDVAENSALMQVIARSEQAEAAQSLLEMLQGLQTVGKAFLGSATTPDKQAIGRMIDNAQIARNGNDVTLDLAIPQSDIDIFVSKLK